MDAEIDQVLEVATTMTKSVPAAAMTEESVPAAAAMTEESVPAAAAMTEESVPAATAMTEESAVPAAAAMAEESAVPAAAAMTEESVPAAAAMTEESVPDATAMAEESAVPAAAAMTEESVPGATAMKEESVPGATAMTEESVPGATAMTEASVPAVAALTEESAHTAAMTASVHAASAMMEDSVLAAAMMESVAAVTDEPVPAAAMTEEPVPAATNTEESVPAAAAVTEEPVPAAAMTEESTPAAAATEESAPAAAMMEPVPAAELVPAMTESVPAATTTTEPVPGRASTELELTTNEGVEESAMEVVGAYVEEEEAWDVGAVARRAESAMRSAGNPSEARKVFDGAIFEWEDAVREDENSNPEREAKLVDLYIAYAGFERGLKQFKQAAKVYDAASQAAVPRASATFWLDYAQFAIDRDKLETAKDLYARALRILDDERAKPVWDAFAAFAAEKLKLPLDSLRDLVFPPQQQQPDENDEVPPPEDDDDAPREIPFTTTADDEPPAKKQKIDHGEVPMLFTRAPVDADLNALSTAGLDAKETADFVKLTREPALVEVVEGLRVVAALQTAEIDETCAAVRRAQADRLRDAATDRDTLAEVLVAIKHENLELQRGAKVELERLNHGIQSILHLAGLPLLEKTNDPRLVERQRIVVRSVLAASRRGATHQTPL